MILPRKAFVEFSAALAARLTLAANDQIGLSRNIISAKMREADSVDDSSNSIAEAAIFAAI